MFLFTTTTAGICSRFFVFFTMYCISWLYNSEQEGKTHYFYERNPKNRLILNEETLLKNILILISEASIIFEDDGRGGEDRATYDTWNEKVRCVRKTL